MVNCTGFHGVTSHFDHLPDWLVLTDISRGKGDPALDSLPPFGLPVRRPFWQDASVFFSASVL